MDTTGLEGLVVRTPWGLRTIRVISAVATSDAAPATIRYSFVEDPAVHYSLTVAPDALASHRDEIQVLVTNWTARGHLNGSALALDTIHPAQPETPQGTSRPLTEN